MGSKSAPPPAAPQPTFTPVAQEPAKPIERAATNANARERADANPEANLLAAKPDEQAAGTKAGLMGTY